MKTTLITSTALIALATGLAAESHGSGSETAQSDSTQMQTDASSGDAVQTTQSGSLCLDGVARYDQNADGELSSDELDSTARASFSAMDANQDGTVTRDEYVTCANVMAGSQGMESDRSEENMAEYDTDGDGELTQQEFMQASASSYDAMSDDPSQQSGMMRLMFLPVSASPDDMGTMTRDEAASRTVTLFVALDEDDSGTVARDEWSMNQPTMPDMRDALNQRFDEADADSSGDLTEDEYSGMIQDRGAAAQDVVAEDYELPMNTLTPDEPAVYYTYPSTM
ncbi:EF-hand domain-containing protein [Citreimonas sp.]|uniref:EF-hand domain-containing protein n=1 Tax=Citreimonas sp. TaxID=3036715 RepID=UPI0035C83D8F